jgi:hypothetical protein
MSRACVLDSFVLVDMLALTLAAWENLPYGAANKMPNLRISPMRFQLIAARTAFAALALAILGAVAAVAGVRLGFLTDKAGRTLMIPATGLGLAALVFALLWLRSALSRNKGEGKRSGLIAGCSSPPSQ